MAIFINNNNNNNNNNRYSEDMYDEHYNDDYEEYDDYDDDEDDEDDNNIVYNSEEISNTKFNLSLCEIYNEKIYGGDTSLNDQFIVLYRFKQLNTPIISKFVTNSISYMHYLLRNNVYSNHSSIRNYNNIIFKIKPEITECSYTTTGEMLCVIKTIWIKLIQRTWKKIYKLRQDVLQKRITVSSLRYRELYNKWPSYCYYCPTLRGMLYDLKIKRIRN
jgi:hypothetical protein